MNYDKLEKELYKAFLKAYDEFGKEVHKMSIYAKYGKFSNFAKNDNKIEIAQKAS